MREYNSFSAINLTSHLLTFEEVFESYFERLCYFAKKIIGRDDIAQDIVQDIFLKVYEKNNIYNSENSFVSFLYSSVKNKCFDYMKHEKVNNRYIDSLKQIDNIDYISAAIIESEVIANINAAILKLPKACSEVMQLSLTGKRNQEIADLLNISIFTVKAQKQRALSLLKDIVSNELLIIIIYITSIKN